MNDPIVTYVYAFMIGLLLAAVIWLLFERDRTLKRVIDLEADFVKFTDNHNMYVYDTSATLARLGGAVQGVAAQVEGMNPVRPPRDKL